MSQGRRSCTWSGHGETAQRPCARNRRCWSQGPGVTVSRGRYPCTCGWECAVPTRTPPKVTTWSPGGDAGATPVLWLGEGFVEGRSRARNRPDWLELKPLPVVGSEETAGRGSQGELGQCFEGQEGPRLGWPSVQAGDAGKPGEGQSVRVWRPESQGHGWCEF